MSNTEVITTSLPLLADFANAFAGLEADGSNWFMFQKRFRVHVTQKDVWEHFDGTSEEPKQPKQTATGAAATATSSSTTAATLSTPSTTATSSTTATPSTTATYKKELAAWKKKEALAMSLLIQKLPDSVYAKYDGMTTVAKMWKAVVNVDANYVARRIHGYAL
jgi:cytoskeletal protein RodZ